MGLPGRRGDHSFSRPAASFTTSLISCSAREWARWALVKGLLASDGKLARRWILWAVAALVAFTVETTVAIAAFSPHASPRSWEVAADCGFVLSCAASSFAFLALFVRFAKSRSKMWESLTANAYGIYLVHYAFVSWLQYSLLKATLPAIAKGWVVILGGVALSWAVTAALRRIPAVARVI